MGRGLGAVLRGMGEFMNGYAKGSETGEKLKKLREDAAVRSEISAADADYAPRETSVASGEEALAAAQQARQNALQGITSEEDAAKVNADFQPTLDALEKQRTMPARVVASMGAGAGFRQQDTPFTPGEVSTAKANAKADIYARAGREDDAGRVLLNEARRRTLTDDAELRAAMTQTTTEETAGAAAAPSAVRSAVARQGVDGIVQQGRDRQAADAYYQRKVPQVVDTYLKQGKVAEAKAYRDFVSSESGRSYAEQWSRGARKLAIGDHRGALNDWQNLYNQQLYDDKRTVKLAPSEDGQQVTATFFDHEGKQIHAMTQPIGAFARQAGMALAPEKLVEFQAQQQAKRESETAVAERQVHLEQLRQQGQEVREDRRDERLQTRLNAQTADLEKRLSAQGRRGGLTLSQQRQNDEIEAARELVGSMSPGEVQRRSQRADHVGRENRDYDPAIARAANLAGRRKIGGDDYFDERRVSPKPAANGADLTKRFAADPRTKGYKLGPVDPKKGLPTVLDAAGKVIGHFE